MIQIFRKNWFVFTLLLFPYAVLTRLWIFFDSPQWPVDIESQSIAYKYVADFFPANYTWNAIIACLLVFINAAQINHITIKNRITREINLYAGMVFIVLSALHKEMFWLSPQLLSITFLLIAIASIFRIYQKPFATLYIFNTGFFIGLSAIFYIPYSIFLVFAIISILILRKFSVKDMIQLISGFVLVFFFTMFLRFWYDQDFTPFIEFKDKFNWALGFHRYMLNEWIIYAICALISLIALMNYRKFTIKKSIQSQKKVNLLYWILLISFLTLPFISSTMIFSALLVVFIPFSIFIAMLMTRSKNEAAMELLHLFILFFIIFSHFWY